MVPDHCPWPGSGGGGWLEAARRQEDIMAAVPDTHVTVVLPRRSYPPLAGRLLHDHTADRIARVVSRIPGAAATRQ
jgi:hypothetical protein